MVDCVDILKSANIITIMFRPFRTHQYSSESEIPSTSHHFQILNLSERKNLSAPTGD